MQRLTTAIVGLGWWADAQAAAIVASQRWRLRSCFTRNAQTRAEFAQRHGCLAAASFDDLLDDGDLQAVIITTPDDTHADLAVRAAAAGKHVFVEKPMAANAKECDAIIEACATAGVRLGIGHNYRYLDAVRKARAVIESGRLGEIIAVLGCFGTESGKSIPPEAWRASRQRCPAGVLSPLGVHLIDLCNYFLGPQSQPQAVTAGMRRTLIPGESGNVAALQVRYSNNVVASLSVLHVVPWILELKLLGAEANLYFTAPTPLLKPEATGVLQLQAAGGAEREEVTLEPRDTARLQLDAFATAISDGTDYAIDGDEGRRAVAVVDAAVQSAAGGCSVPVEL